MWKLKEGSIINYSIGMFNIDTFLNISKSWSLAGQVKTGHPSQQHMLNCHQLTWCYQETLFKDNIIYLWPRTYKTSFSFFMFSVKILTIPNDLCFLSGTDIVQFLSMLMSQYSEVGSLKNVNVHLISQKPF